MLSDRIQKTGRGFSVIKEDEAGEDKKVLYGTYTLKEKPDHIPELKEAMYWKPMTDSEIAINGPGCFVYVAEMQNDQTVEEDRFYWSPASAKPLLSISTSQADKRYGKQAYMITIRWENSEGEPINNAYLFLKSANGEVFHFLRKVIGGKGIKEERFIYIVPEDDAPELYSVAVLPQLKEKYTVSMD